MKAGPCYLDVLPLNTAGALGTGVAHVGHVVLMAVDLVVELVVGSLYHIAAHTATALGLLEVLLADWFVLKEQVGVSQGLLADIALKRQSGELGLRLELRLTYLHTARVIEGLVVDHTVPDYLLFTDTALLLGVLQW